MRSENPTVDQATPSFIETARRSQIIDCAIETIADLGFNSASLAQIAKRAKISTGVILYYFAGKEDLIREVVAHVFATGEAFITPRVNQDDARQALLDFIEGSVAYAGAYPKYVRAVMNIMRAGRTESGALRFDPAVESPRRDGFRNILAWGQRVGAFRSFDVRVMAMTIIEAVDAVHALMETEPDLKLADYSNNLVELFDRATRADAPIESGETP